MIKWPVLRNLARKKVSKLKGSIDIHPIVSQDERKTMRFKISQGYTLKHSETPGIVTEITNGLK